MEVPTEEWMLSSNCLQLQIENKAKLQFFFTFNVEL